MWSLQLCRICSRKKRFASLESDLRDESRTNVLVRALGHERWIPTGCALWELKIVCMELALKYGLDANLKKPEAISITEISVSNMETD